MMTSLMPGDTVLVETSHSSKSVTIWIEYPKLFIRYGFLPGDPVRVSWEKSGFRCVSSTSDNQTDLINDNPVRPYLNLVVPGNRPDISEGSKFRIRWTQGVIRGELLPPIPPPDSFPSEWDRLISLLDHSKSSNTKYKNPQKGEHHSPISLISGLLGIPQEDVYIVGVTSRVHNIRKNLLQSTQNKHSIGIGIYTNEDWETSLVERYCKDSSIVTNFRDGVIIFCATEGLIRPIGMSVIGKKIPFKMLKAAFQDVIDYSENDSSTTPVLSRSEGLDSNLIAAARILPEIADLSGMSDREIGIRTHMLAEEMKIAGNLVQDKARQILSQPITMKRRVVAMDAIQEAYSKCKEKVLSKRGRRYTVVWKSQLEEVISEQEDVSTKTARRWLDKQILAGNLEVIKRGRKAYIYRSSTFAIDDE